MMNKPLHRAPRGFTLVEILVILAILVLVIGFVTIGFRNFASFQQYNQAVSEVRFMLETTQQQARSANDDASHGVKFSPSSLISFVGDAYVVGDPQNDTATYSLVTLQYDLTGGADEVIFAKLTGLPSATGTVTIIGERFIASTTIEITAAGVIQ
jgi:type II secretory pathway pseudopilin PulG